MSETAPISFELISLPEYTPEKSELFITGNFNNWSSGDEKYKLENNNGIFQITLNFQKDTIVLYKFTRGNWETVEKGKNGEEIPNRILKIDSPKTIEIKIENWRDLVENKRKSTITGDVRIIEDFSIPQLNRKRTIRLYLPPDYESSRKNYPVLYMHDGQNLFDDATSFVGEWQIDETLERFFREEKTAGVIIVGIDHGIEKRMDEYSPWKNSKYGGGEGDLYLEFIVRTLKPFIDKEYRTRPEGEFTGIAGSSMGGLISLYAGLKYPEVFSKIGIFSPAFWFAEQEFIEFINSSDVPQLTKFYFDVGTEEDDDLMSKPYLSLTKNIFNLVKSETRSQNVRLIIDEGAFHNEQFWAKRFPDAFLWLFEE